MKAIKCENLTKKFKNINAVDGLNFEVEEGELVSLLGTNGAGKSTTLKMLCGLLKPTSGDAKIFDESIQKDEFKKFVAVSPQETAVAPGLSVRENLELMCGVHGFSKEKQKLKKDKNWKIYN